MYSYPEFSSRLKGRASFSSRGSAKNSLDRRNVSSISSVEMPWLMMVKNPTVRAAFHIWSATSSGEFEEELMSITGMVTLDSVETAALFIEERSRAVAEDAIVSVVRWVELETVERT